MNILYPGTCLVEGTNLSEGRGQRDHLNWLVPHLLMGKS